MKTLLMLLLLSPLLNANDKVINFKLKGKSLLEVTIFKFDVYKISYFESDSGFKKIKLNYLRDVEKKYTVMGWEKGLEKYTEEKDLKNAIKWFKSTAADIKEKDIVEIITGENKVSFYKNGQKTFESNDSTIIKLALAPWIGKYPIDKDIKKDLLGK